MAAAERSAREYTTDSAGGTALTGAPKFVPVSVTDTLAAVPIDVTPAGSCTPVSEGASYEYAGPSSAPVDCPPTDM
ncbi:hypothetical protein ACI3PL_25195, partial [Lacticaseibacillus paracasei]